jgi:hypothetical protein
VYSKYHFVIFIKNKTARKYLRKAPKAGKEIIKFSLFILLVGISLPYYRTEIYDFEPTQPFHGNEIYNPYENWKPENLQKLNLHAHSHAWAGLTYGKNTQKELKTAYSKAGYKIPIASNYHLSDDEHFNQKIWVYEHGINLNKAHKLAINTPEVSYFDFPLWQNRSQKQQIIKELVQSGGMVAIAHPNVRNGHADLSDMRGYQFTEVLSHYANARNIWDRALLSGNLSWLLANDDTHDITKQKIGSFYNLLSENNDPIETLKSGNYLGLKTLERSLDFNLEYLRISEGTLRFKFSPNVTQVAIIIDGKKAKLTSENKGTIQLNEVRHYIRFEAENTSAQVFTNPIVRTTQKNQLDRYSAIQTINFTKTFIYRSFILLLNLSLFLIFYPKTIFQPKRKLLTKT